MRKPSWNGVLYYYIIFHTMDVNPTAWRSPSKFIVEIRFEPKTFWSNFPSLGNDWIADLLILKITVPTGEILQMKSTCLENHMLGKAALEDKPLVTRWLLIWDLSNPQGSKGQISGFMPNVARNLDSHNSQEFFYNRSSWTWHKYINRFSVDKKRSHLSPAVKTKHMQVSI